MNRKGFAVTAVIYGLSILGILIITILMGTLSSSRNNVSEEAKRIEKELIAFNKSSVTYTTGQYYYTVPEGETGWYRIEAFGRSIMDAKGAYTTGIIYLQEGRTLFVSIPEDDTDSVIKVNNAEGPEIMRAAGGLGGIEGEGTEEEKIIGEYPGGTLRPYCQEPLGGNIELETFKLIDNYDLIGTENVSFNGDDCPGAKTSYIAGYPGSGDGQVVDGFAYYFVDGFMIPASHAGGGKVVIQLISRQTEETNTIPRANPTFDNAQGIRIVNNSGVAITGIYVTANGSSIYSFTSTSLGGEEAPLGNGTNQIFSFGGVYNIDDISIIFDTSGHKHIRNVDLALVRENTSEELIYTSTGSNLGFTSVPTGIKMSAYQPNGMQDLPNHGSYYFMPVVSNNKIVTARKDSETDSNPIGIEYINGDARQKWEFDVINFRNVMSGRKEYYITESSRYKSIAIYRDENVVKNRVTASMTFNTLSRNPPQIWIIKPMKDGTYTIRTVVESYLSSKRSGFLTVNTSRNEDGTGTEYYDQVMIGYAENYMSLKNASDDDEIPTISERFRVYALDFSHTR